MSDTIANPKKFTAKTVENAKPKSKPYKISTGLGFYVFVKPNGSKLWRYDYRQKDSGKRGTAS